MNSDCAFLLAKESLNTGLEEKAEEFSVADIIRTFLIKQQEGMK